MQQRRLAPVEERPAAGGVDPERSRPQLGEDAERGGGQGDEGEGAGWAEAPLQQLAEVA